MLRVLARTKNVRLTTRTFASGSAKRPIPETEDKKVIVNTPPLPSAAPTNGGGGGSSGLTIFAVATAAFGGLVLYQLKEDDLLRETVESNPVVGSYIRPITNALLGEMKSSPASTQSTSAPALINEVKIEKKKNAVVAKPAPAAVEEKKIEKVVEVKPAPVPVSVPVTAPTPPTPKTAPTPVAAAPAPPPPAPVISPSQSEISLAFDSIATTASNLKLSNIKDATDELLVVSIALKRELDATILNDIDSLDAKALRYRIVQLAAEMQERTKWEALRLREFLAQAEKKTGEKYLGMLQEQRLKYEGLIGKEMNEQEERLNKIHIKEVSAKTDTIKAKFEAEWNARTTEWRSELVDAFEVKYGNDIAEYKLQLAKDYNSSIAEVNTLKAKIGELEGIVNKVGLYEEKSGKVHRIVGGIMGLIGAIEKGDDDVKADIVTLKKICKDDDVVVAALDQVNKGLEMSHGKIASLSELQQRFKTVSKIGRKMALAGDETGLSGIIAGQFYSTVLVPVDPEVAMKKGEDADDEERLAKAAYYVGSGKIEDAMGELEKVKSKKVKTVVNDWVVDAKAKVSVDECVGVLKLRCSALNMDMQ